jgi:hypothetical protein
MDGLRGYNGLKRFRRIMSGLREINYGLGRLRRVWVVQNEFEVVRI